MSIADYSQFVLALLFVLGLIGAAALLARRFGLGQSVRFSAGRRLTIVESMALDGKRRLLLVRRDDVEHLLLLGPSSELLVERGIAAPRDALAVPEVNDEN